MYYCVQVNLVMETVMDNATDPFLLRLKQVIDSNPQINVSNLATKAGLSDSAIRQMFSRNTAPRLPTMRAICTALGTTLEEFMQRDYDYADRPRTHEEKRIRQLVSQLTKDDQLLLLSYGLGLRDARGNDSPESPQDDE